MRKKHALAQVGGTRQPLCVCVEYFKGAYARPHPQSPRYKPVEKDNAGSGNENGRLLGTMRSRTGTYLQT